MHNKCETNYNTEQIIQEKGYNLKRDIEVEVGGHPQDCCQIFESSNGVEDIVKYISENPNDFGYGIAMLGFGRLEIVPYNTNERQYEKDCFATKVNIYTDDHAHIMNAVEPFARLRK